MLSQTTENSSRFGSPHSDSVDILTQTKSNVNTSDKRFSLSPTDSQGNTLSEQQREYFKDSKDVDKNGWEHRKVYIMMQNNKIYTVTLNVAKTRDGRNILYDVNEIKKVDTKFAVQSPKVKNSSNVSTTNIIPDNSGNVNCCKKYFTVQKYAQ